MEVTVEQMCGRCGKSEVRKVSLDEANKIGEVASAKEAAQTKLKMDVGSWLEQAEHAPEALIAQRQSDGRYTVTLLDDLCSTGPKEGKGKRGCLERVGTLIREILMDNRDAKKPTSKKVAPPATATVVEGNFEE